MDSQIEWICCHKLPHETVWGKIKRARKILTAIEKNVVIVEAIGLKTL